MSVPSRKPLPAQSFFGKSYPRAIGALTDDDKLMVGNSRPQLPNAPFLSEMTSPLHHNNAVSEVPSAHWERCVRLLNVVCDDKGSIGGVHDAEWAGTADWRRGGTGSHWVGKPPKEPITPFEAYEMYLDSQAAKTVAEAAQQKDGSQQEPDGNKEIAVRHS